MLMEDTTLRDYLDVSSGQAIREVARSHGDHASTVMRRHKRVQGLVEGNQEWLDAALNMRDLWDESSKFTRRADAAFVAQALDIPLKEALTWWVSRMSDNSLRHATVAVAEFPKAILSRRAGNPEPFKREIAIFGLVMGWMHETHNTEKMRKYSLASSAPDAIRSLVEQTQGKLAVKPVRAKRILSSDSPALKTHRRNPELISRADLNTAADFRDNYNLREVDTLHRQQFDEKAEKLPPKILEVLIELVGKETPLEKYEAERTYPARSAKALLSISLDCLRHVSAKEA